MTDVKMKVMIVEDEMVIALATKLQLENQGYKVTGMSSNESSFWKTIQIETPDVILMDIKLKNNDCGVEIAKKFRQQNQSTPIIFTTGNSMSVTEKETKDVVNSQIINKPLNYQLLYNTLESIQKKL